MAVCDYCGTDAFGDEDMVDLGGMTACPECCDTADDLGISDILG